MTSEWIHQLIRPARVSSASRHDSRNVIISVAMKPAMTIDSSDTVGPRAAGRTIPRRIAEEHDAAEDANRERRQQQPICMEPAGVRQVDDAEAAEELDGRVEAEGHEAPEDEGVRGARDRPLADGAALPDDVDEKATDSEAEVVGAEGIGGADNQADACRDLRSERAHEDDHEQPEQQRFHQPVTLEPATTSFVAFVITRSAP